MAVAKEMEADDFEDIKEITATVSPILVNSVSHRVK